MNAHEPRYIYSGSGNYRIEITVTSVEPFVASVRYAQTLFKDYPALGFRPLPIVPPSLERQACAAMAGICRQHGAEAEAGAWEARAQSVKLLDRVERLFQVDHDRSR